MFKEIKSNIKVSSFVLIQIGCTMKSQKSERRIKHVLLCEDINHKFIFFKKHVILIHA